MRILVAAVPLVLMALSGCIGGDEDATASLLIDFGPANPTGIHDIFVDIEFDSDSRPSQGAYAGRDTEHPDAFTVHDLLVEWEGAASLVFTYYAGLGYTLDEVLGVAADFTDGCWFWELRINNEPALLGIGQQPVEDGDKVALHYTDCSPPPPEPWSADLTFDFNGTAPEGLDDVMSQSITFDPTSRPSASAYNASTIGHPNNFTVHDLMVVSDAADALGYSYFGGLGFSLDSVYGVAGQFSMENNETICWFWMLAIDGEPSMQGLSTAVVHDGAAVRWTYTGC